MAKNSRNYQRLLFIEAALIVRGDIDRKELDQAFGSSDSNSRLSIKQYKIICPDNITETGRGSALERIRSQVFKPVFFDEDMGKRPAKEYLHACHVMGGSVKRAKERMLPEDIPSSFMLHRHVPRRR